MINQLWLHQNQEAALDHFREEMLTLGVVIIEHSILYFGAAPSNNKMNLAKFRFKEDDEDFVCNEESDRELCNNNIPPCSNSLTRLTDLQKTADTRASVARAN